MGKSFGILAALVATVVGLVALGVVWVGPTLVNLALFDNQRHQPYTLLSFTRGQPAEIYEVRYKQPMAGLIASEGGELLAGYRLSALLEGTHFDEWPYLNQLHVAHAQDLVQVMTSAPYRLLHGSFSGLQSAQLGSYDLPQTDWRRVVVIWLLETDQSSSGEVTNSKGIVGDPLDVVSAELSRGEGRIVWNASVTPLIGGMSWDRIYVVDFASEASAYAWLGYIEVGAARSLANARVRNLALAVYVRDPDLT